MKKQQKGALMLLALITFTFSTLFYYTQVAFAEITAAHVRIVGTSRTIWFGDVTTDGCTMTDNTGVNHTFTDPVALCALDEAAKTGNFAYSVKDFGGSLGLFLDVIAEDAGAADFSTYWLYDVNGIGASEGISNYIVKSGDSLFFHFENPDIDLNQRAVNDGLNYLRSQQDATGQISGFSGVSSWAAMTFAGAGVDIDTVENGGSSLLEYLSVNPPTTESNATDWERALLAITASGEDPYDFGGVNYAENLEGYHNNSQLGSTTQVNDDVFGLLALISVESGASAQIKQDSLDFILSHQLSDGGFSWSTTGASDVDDTSAALQAMVAAKKFGMSGTGLTDSINSAKAYLLSAQNNDGGFPYSVGESSNSSTTAWAAMALSALDMNGEESANAKTYLRGAQEENGSFKWQPSSTGETFTSSYAVLALTGKYWPVKVFAQTSPSPIPSNNPKQNARDRYMKKLRKTREEQRAAIEKMREQIRKELDELLSRIKLWRF